MGCALAIGTWSDISQAQPTHRRPGVRPEPTAEPVPRNPAEVAADPELPPGVLNLELGEEVRGIVALQIAAALGEAAETTRIHRIDKDTVLDATVGEVRYRAAVFKSFNVVSIEGRPLAISMFYIRTLAPWRLERRTIPADVYLAFDRDGYRVVDPDVLAAVEEAKAINIRLYKEYLDALDEVQPAAEDAKLSERDLRRLEALERTIEEAPQQVRDADLLLEQLKREQTLREERRKEMERVRRDASSERRKQIDVWIETLDGRTLFNTRRQEQASEWLARTKDRLEAARKQHAEIREQDEKTRDAAAEAAKATRARVRAVYSKHRRALQSGTPLTEKEMRANYEKAVGRGGRSADEERWIDGEYVQDAL